MHWLWTFLVSVSCKCDLQNVCMIILIQVCLSVPEFCVYNEVLATKCSSVLINSSPTADGAIGPNWPLCICGDRHGARIFQYPWSCCLRCLVQWRCNHTSECGTCKLQGCSISVCELCSSPHTIVQDLNVHDECMQTNPFVEHAECEDKCFRRSCDNLDVSVAGAWCFSVSASWSKRILWTFKSTVIMVMWHDPSMSYFCDRQNGGIGN